MTKKLDDATKMLVDSLPENLQKLASSAIENGYFSQSDFVEATTLDEIPSDEQAEVLDFFQQDLGLEVVESESYSKDMDLQIPQLYSLKETSLGIHNLCPCDYI